MCVTNCLYYADCLKANGIKNVKIKTSYWVDDRFIQYIHLVIFIDDFMIDPSYDVHKIKNKNYHLKLCDVKVKSKELITEFLSLRESEVKINNGEFVISDKLYYYNQATYIEQFIASLH